MTVTMVMPENDKATAVAEALSRALSETIVETAKAQSFHWNVTGMSFGPLHALFQEIYEDHFAAQDLVAERIRAIGAFVDGRLSYALSNSSITESEGTPRASDMLRELAQDQRTLAESMIEVAQVADEHGDLGTNDLAIQRAQVHDKFAWMLESHVSA